MYFGSVRFFKHLIIGTVLLIIVIPVVLCIVLGADNSRKDAQIERLEREIAVSSALSGDGEPLDAELLLTLYKESEDKEAFLKLLSEYDSELYSSFAEQALPALNSNTTTSPPALTPAQTSSETTSASTTEGITAEAQTTTTPVSAASEQTTTEPDAPAYQSLYPELYVSSEGEIIYNTDMDYLYLTFDDGPSKYTENILGYLDKHNIKATFFVVPNGTDESNALLKKIADAGHTIGVHSATHQYGLIYSSVESYLEDFKIAFDRIYKATGVRCELFRFPGGSINDFNEDFRDEIIAEMTRRGFIYFDWNVDSGDAAGATWTEMYNGVLTQVADKNRAVILMHDHNNGYNTVLVLEDIINALKNDARGFKFDKLTKYTKPIQF